MPDTKRGVAYSTAFARFEDEILESGGIQTRPYASKVFLWPRTEETVEFRSDGDRPSIVCNTRDGLQVTMETSFQYFPVQENIRELTEFYGSFKDWEELMISQAEAVIRHVCGDFIADEFQTNRGAVALSMEQQVRNSTLSKFDAEVTKLQLTSIDRVAEYENAVRDKENARSEIALADNERAQALTRATTALQVADQERARLLNTANTESNIILAQANATSEAIRDQFQQLANVYALVKQVNGFDTTGILSYISNEVFHKDVTIAVDLPAQVTFRDEL